MRWRIAFLSGAVVFLFQSCNKTDDEMPEGRYGYYSTLNLAVVIDTSGDHLDSCNNPSVVPAGHGSQTPYFNYAHIDEVELFDEPNTGYGYGSLFTANYSNVDQTIFNTENTFILSNHRGEESITFHWIRLYFTYQNFRVKCKIGGNVFNSNLLSFLHSYEAFQHSLLIEDSLITLDSIKNKGEWFLEDDSFGAGMILHGQTAQTTSPNPFCGSLSSPPDMIYVLTCPISSGITFHKADSKSLKISISINHCFEWIEHSDPSYFEPLDGDTIFDFGFRGAKVIQ